MDRYSNATIYAYVTNEMFRTRAALIRERRRADRLAWCLFAVVSVSVVVAVLALVR